MHNLLGWVRLPAPQPTSYSLILPSFPAKLVLMVKQEDDKQEPIRVKRGEPFGVTPDFSKVPSHINEGETALFEAIEIEIEDLGHARVSFVVDAGLSNVTAPIETPAGPITISTVLRDNTMTPMINTLPILVNVEVYKTGERSLDAITCKMTIGEQHYQGELLRDGVTINEAAREIVDGACFYEWENVKTGISPVVYLPQDVSVFNNVKFVVE